jgi:hypothetical protein
LWRRRTKEERTHHTSLSLPSAERTMAPRKRGPAAKFLIAFNAFTFIVGLTFIVAGSWAYAQFSDNSWTSWTNRNMSGLGIATGVFTLVMSLLGLCAAMLQRKCILAIYVCFFVIIISLQLASASGIMYFSSTFKMRDDSYPSGALTAPQDIVINNAVFSLYTQCCTGCPANAACNNTQIPASIVNRTTINCYNQNCRMVGSCDSVTQTKCFVFPNSTVVTSWGISPQPVLVPPMVFDPRMCTSILNYAQGPDGKLVVGPAIQGGCGGGDPKAFLYALDGYVSGIA